MAEDPTPHRLPAQPSRVWLDVPYAEKDQAKALGARWDQAAKRWFDPRPPTPGLQRWAARPDVPDLLPGEDRGFGQGLFVDLVPSSCWFTNVRTCVTPQDWERLRRMTTRRAGQQCEACGAGEDRAAQRWLETHERWAYDETTGVQALRRVICLCSACHESTHMGRANVTGRGPEARAHLRAVTGMTDAETWLHIDAAEDLWITRSRRDWTLDLSILTDAGITLAPPESPASRRSTAQRELEAVNTAPLPPSPSLPPARTPADRPPAASTPQPCPGPQPSRWWQRLIGRR